MVALVGAGVVAHQASDAIRFPVRLFSDEVLPVSRGQAQPVHAGIQMQPGRMRSALSPPCLNRGQVIEDRCQAMRDQLVHMRLHLLAEHDDCHIGQVRPQSYALCQGGDEERFTPGGVERLGDGRHPQAIGIGLDHRRRLGRRRQGGQLLPIGDDRGQVNGQPA